MKRTLAALGAALALGAASTAALAEDVYIYSVPDNSHDLQPAQTPTWMQGEPSSAYEESVIVAPAGEAVIEVPARTDPVLVTGPYDVYVVEPDPSTPSTTGQLIGDGLFNRTGPNDFGS
jgi:hypothetical protein